VHGTGGPSEKSHQELRAKEPIQFIETVVPNLEPQEDSLLKEGIMALDGMKEY
jgi:hypothetical protein